MFHMLFREFSTHRIAKAFVLAFMAGGFLAIAIGLSSCSVKVKVDPQPTDASTGWNSGVGTEVTAGMFVSRATGKITRYIDATGMVVFDEGYATNDEFVPESTLDKAAEVDAKGRNGTDYGAIPLTTEVVVNNAPYRVSASIRPAELAGDKIPDQTALISFFNQKLASTDPGASVELLRGESLWYLWYDQATAAVRSAQLPALQLSTTATVSSADPAVAAAWQQGLTPWQAYERTTGKQALSSAYAYQFTCASYTVQVNNSDSVAAAATSALAAAGFGPYLQGYFSVNPANITFTVNTPEPCAVTTVNTGSQDQSQGAGTASKGGDGSNG